MTHYNSINLNVAGYSKDEVSISYDPVFEYLHVKAKNNEQGEYSKIVYVPENLSKYISAKYNNGLLTVSISEESRKPISIKIT